MYLLYNLGLRLATVLIAPWAIVRSFRGRLPGLRERLGFFSWQDSSRNVPVIWVHAVSVGEVKAAAALVQELKERILNLRVVMTSSTRTGWNAARQLLGPEDAVLFPPWDLLSVCRSFLRRIRPKAVIVLETELWPNLFRECKRFGAVLLIANGRISQKTFPRYRATAFFWRRVLQWPDALFLQSSGDAERLRAIGAPAEKVRLAANLKFASKTATSPLVASLREMAGDSSDSTAGPVIVAGSTMPGEEKYLLDAFQELLPEFPRLWMILAPRHPERCGSVKEQVRARGIPFQLRSQWNAQSRPVLPGILLLDCMGELAALYELATVAYVGGTLVPTGGHNILEPACFARPIVIGPSMTNFQEIADQFLHDAPAQSGASPDEIRTGAIIQISNPSSLTPVFRLLFNDPALRRRLGNAACACWKQSTSGAAPIANELLRLLAMPAAALRQPAAAPSREIVGAGKME